MQDATGRGRGWGMSLSAQQPWARWPRQGPGLISGVKSQQHVFLPAPGGEAQTSPVSWSRLRGRLCRASLEV